MCQTFVSFFLFLNVLIVRNIMFLFKEMRIHVYSVYLKKCGKVLHENVEVWHVLVLFYSFLSGFRQL